MKGTTTNKLATLLTATLLLASCASQSQQPWNVMKTIDQQIVAPTFPDKEYLITDYHTDGDTLYTEAIRRAIEACANNGGGRVVIPAGDYLTGPIQLKSNVNLHVSQGATVRFVTDPKLFPTVLTRIEGIDCYNISPLIYAYDETNVAITGTGTLDGQADTTNWFSQRRIGKVKLPDGTEVNEKTRLYQMKEDSVALRLRVFEGEEGIRPQFINLYKCKNVLLEGFTLHRSPFWLIHPLMSENVTVRRVTMDSHGNNNDGCDPESCTNVRIEECNFNTGDDCIAIKSGRDEDGRYWNLPSQNIIVRNCSMKDGHAGVAIGSEITGGCYNVWVEGCQMDSPALDRIIRIKSNAIRGGEVKNVYVRNLTVGECRRAILGFEQKYWHVDDGPYPPYFHNIHLENITSQKSQYVLMLDGFEDEVQARDIYLKNCQFNGVTEPEINKVTGVENIQFEDVTVNGQPFKEID